MTEKTADKTEVKLPVIKDGVTRVSGITTDNHSVAKDGTTTIDDSLYAKTLPEDLTVEVVEKVRQADANFVAGVPDSIGKSFVKAMADNKDLNELTTEVSMLGGKSLGVHVARSQTYPGVKGADGVAGPSTTKHGVLTVKVSDKSEKGSTGQVGAVRTHLAAYGAKLLADSNK